MKTTHMAIVSVLVLTAIALGGCCKGIKVSFINSTPKPIVVTYTTVGLNLEKHEHEAEYKIGDIDPGQKKKCCLHYDEELIEGEPQLNVTIDGGTTKSKTAIIGIRRKPYTQKKLVVDIASDPDTGYVITVTNEKGESVPTK